MYAKNVQDICARIKNMRKSIERELDQICEQGQKSFAYEHKHVTNRRFEALCGERRPDVLQGNINNPITQQHTWCGSGGGRQRKAGT
jgi:hypothetical protein